MEEKIQSTLIQAYTMEKYWKLKNNEQYAWEGLVKHVFSLLTGNLQLKDDSPRTVPLIHLSHLPCRSGGIYGNIPRNV